MTAEADLVVAGGRVATPSGVVEADVAIRGGRIEAVERGLHDRASDPAVVDASGLLVLPGVVDVHTHTRLPIDEEPDRFLQDSVAAAFGGTTTFLAFNNPGTGIEETRSLMGGVREWRSRTEGESAIDYALSVAVTGQMDDPVGELPAAVEAGVPTFKAFMVFDFALDDASLFRLLRASVPARALIELHCENRVLLEAGIDEHLNAGLTAPRYHASSRPPVVEAEATYRGICLAAAAGAPLYIVHLSCAAALRHVREAKAAGQPVFAETCPHYLTLDESRYEAPEEEAALAIISPPLRAPADRFALWAGLAAGDLDLVATDHVPDRRAVEKRIEGVSFDRISNGAPGIETLLTLVYSEGVAKGRITLERMAELLSAAPARLFGLERKGSIEVGKDADLVLFDPAPRRTIRAADLHHTSDYTPYEGLEVRGAVRSVFVRGEPVIRDGAFAGRRGFGRFQERTLAAYPPSSGSNTSQWTSAERSVSRSSASS